MRRPNNVEERICATETSRAIRKIPDREAARAPDQARARAGTKGKGSQGGASPDNNDKPPQAQIVVAAAVGGLVGGLVGALIGSSLNS